MIESNVIFFDTSPIVYYLEKNEQYFNKISQFIKENANARFITSTITVTEYSVNPYRIGKPELVDAFRQYLEVSRTYVINIDCKIADKAAKIRAKYKAFKTMDSLQLATAVINGCDIFLTNDTQLRQFDEIQCLIVDTDL